MMKQSPPSDFQQPRGEHWIVGPIREFYKPVLILVWALHLVVVFGAAKHLDISFAGSAAGGLVIVVTILMTLLEVELGLYFLGDQQNLLDLRQTQGKFLTAVFVIALGVSGYLLVAEVRDNHAPRIVEQPRPSRYPTVPGTSEEDIARGMEALRAIQERKNRSATQAASQPAD